MNIKEIDIAAQFQTQHLKPTDSVRLLDLIREYRNLFLFEGTELGCTSKVKHRIIISDVHPIAKAPYRVPFAQKEVLTKQISELLDGAL